MKRVRYKKAPAAVPGGALHVQNRAEDGAMSNLGVET